MQELEVTAEANRNGSNPRPAQAEGQTNGSSVRKTALSHYPSFQRV